VKPKSQVAEGSNFVYIPLQC